MSDKDIEAFRALCERWQRNKAALDFHANTIKEGVKINVSIENYPQEFKDSLYDLAKQIIAGGVQYVSSKMIFPVASDDQPGQLKQVGRRLHKVIVPLLDYLLEYGYEAFDVQVRNHAHVFQMEYELSHLQFDKNGNWIRWTGQLWNGNTWAGGDSCKSDPIAKVLASFMESQFVV